MQPEEAFETSPLFELFGRSGAPIPLEAGLCQKPIAAASLWIQQEHGREGHGAEEVTWASPEKTRKATVV